MNKYEWPIVRTYHQKNSKYCVPYSVAHVMAAYIKDFLDNDGGLRYRVRIRPLPFVYKAFRAGGFTGIFNRAINLPQVAEGINKYGATGALDRVAGVSEFEFRTVTISALKTVPSAEFPNHTEILTMLEKSPLLAYRAASHAVAIVGINNNSKNYKVIDPQTKGGYKMVSFNSVFDEVHNIFPSFQLHHS